jgi:predicted aspartyl protease
MKSYVNEYGHPVVEITVVGSRGSATAEAILDTGFDGDVCLPTQVAIQLGLELAATQLIELADGTRKRELVFAGEGVFEDEVRKVEIILTEAQDTLVGSRLLADKILEIDFPNRMVEIR